MPVKNTDYLSHFLLCFFSPTLSGFGDHLWLIICCTGEERTVYKSESTVFSKSNIPVIVCIGKWNQQVGLFDF